MSKIVYSFVPEGSVVGRTILNGGFPYIHSFIQFPTKRDAIAYIFQIWHSLPERYILVELEVDPLDVSALGERVVWYNILGTVSDGVKSVDEALEEIEEAEEDKTEEEEEVFLSPFPAGSDLDDCYRWLLDCGGQMAYSNNPMADQLVREGVAERGGYDSLGRRTLILKSK